MCNLTHGRNLLVLLHCYCNTQYEKLIWTLPFSHLQHKYLRVKTGSSIIIHCLDLKKQPQKNLCAERVWCICSSVLKSVVHLKVMFEWHLWDELECRLYVRPSHLTSLIPLWLNGHQSPFQNLLKSLPRRLEAVIDAKAGPNSVLVAMVFNGIFNKHMWVWWSGLNTLLVHIVYCIGFLLTIPHFLSCIYHILAQISQTLGRKEVRLHSDRQKLTAKQRTREQR